MSIAEVKEPGSDVVVEITNEHDLVLATMRHSTAHLMAEAVQEIYPRSNSRLALRSRTASTTIWICLNR